MTRRAAIAGCVIAGSVVTAACNDPTGTPTAATRLATDSAHYTAVPIGNDQVTVRVITTFLNTAAVPVSLERCFPTDTRPIFTVTERASLTGDGPGYNAAEACVGAVPPIVVAPGASRVDTLQLRGPTIFDDGQDRYIGDLAGTFQISYGGLQSNTFSVVLPPGGVVPPVARDLDPAIQTDRLLVNLHYRAPLYEVTTPMHLSIFNPRADTSFVVNCNGETGVALEKQVGTEWVRAWSAAVPACLSPAIAIPPLGHYETSLDLFGVGRNSSGIPQFTVDQIPGVYRLVYSQIVDRFSMQAPLSGALVAESYRRSNAFAIVIDP